MSVETSFANATAVAPIDNHTYSVNFPDDWCIGSVPHGGFVTSAFLSVVAMHFRTTLSKQNQPHTMILHLDFVRRTQAGPAQFKVRDVKLGRQTSTIHVTLSQGPREEVLGYITHGNLETQIGPSFLTNFSLTPAAVPADIVLLRKNTDPSWALQENMPFANFRKAIRKVKIFFPRRGQYHPSMSDQWISFANGERFTNESLGYVADTFPQLVEGYLNRDPHDVDLADGDSIRAKSKAAMYWYPTLALGLDFKKALPPEGVDWLFTRVRSKSIQNGKLDLEVIIMDEQDRLIALSHHVSMVVPASRNLASRRDSERNKSQL
ncbi:MAG: hypothetical protein M1833_005839 [Piccolia ochrophora]|nr:MAG: hypothetical protein M1833_005839 [Piccolia ochrophora]